MAISPGVSRHPSGAKIKVNILPSSIIYQIGVGSHGSGWSSHNMVLLKMLSSQIEGAKERGINSGLLDSGRGKGLLWRWLMVMVCDSGIVV